MTQADIALDVEHVTEENISPRFPEDFEPAYIPEPDAIPEPEAIVEPDPIIEQEVELPMTKSKTGIEKKGEKDWDGLLEYLFSVSPVTASNLEQGNILGPIEKGQNKLSINLGFPNTAKVFWDYLQAPDIYKKLINHFSTYFEYSVAAIDLKLTLVDDAKRKESNFESKVEIVQRKESEILENRKGLFIKHPVIIKAEELFNSKIDKVVMNRSLIKK